MSDLLKVKVGGSSYLCKWEDKGILYETDFSNFDLTTGIDIPIKGKNGLWQISNPSGTGVLSKTTIIVDGETYNCLFIKGTTGVNKSTDIILSNLTDFIQMTDEIVSVEATVYKDTYSGTLGGLVYSGKTCPYYNCWTPGRGLGLGIGGDYKAIYNDFHHVHDGCWYNSESSTVTNIAVLGITRVGSNFKYYAFGKKAVWQENITPTNSLYFYANSSSQYGGGIMDYYILNFKIYKGIDRFEQME